MKNKFILLLCSLSLCLLDKVGAQTCSSWKSVSSGLRHTLAIQSDGSLWAWGENTSGQLGTGNNVPSNEPVRIGTDTWTKVVAGQFTSLGIKSNGTLWAWGDNRSGSFGNNSTLASLVPVPIGSDTWIDISSGGTLDIVTYNTSFGIKSDGTMWAWGANLSNQLGLGAPYDDESSVLVPAKIGTSSDWVNVSTGIYHTVALKSSGTLWWWGYGYGQYGNSAVGLPTQIGTDTDWGKVSAGDNHSLCIKTNGSLYAWGSNGWGRLGDGTYISKSYLVPIPGTWKNVEASSDFSVGIQSDGTLWAWGSNIYGCLGIGSTSSAPSPVKVGVDTRWVTVTKSLSNSNFSIKSDGTLWACGGNGYGNLGDATQISKSCLLQIAPCTKWKIIAANGCAVFAIKADGTLWAFGGNYYGQLGDGTLASRSSPVQIGTDKNWVHVTSGNNFTLALKQDGTLWAWGNNSYGQLGDNTTTDKYSPTQIQGLWSSVSAGDGHSLGVKTDGTLWVWGNNFSSQLGIQTSTLNIYVPTKLGQEADWSSVSAGGGSSFALKNDGTLFVWGSNPSGQLGVGNNTSTQPSPVQIVGAKWKAVKAGIAHALGIKQDGTLWAWGNNTNGQLGIGNISGGVNTPTQVVGTNAKWTDISVGLRSSFGIRTDGSLWAWGNNELYQFGNGNFISSNVPIQIGLVGTCFNSWVGVCSRSDNNVVAVKSDGTFWQWSGFQYCSTLDVTPIMTPVQFSLTPTWQSVYAGYSHSVGLKADGTLWSWGQNNIGQLGNSSYNQKTSPTPIGNEKLWTSVSAGYNFSVGIKYDGSLWTWGDNSAGQFGNGTTGTQSNVPVNSPSANLYKNATAGGFHVLAFAQSPYGSNVLFAWGSNFSGQLGDGTTVLKNTPVQIGSGLPGGGLWNSVAAGRQHSLGIKDDGSLWAWGDNSFGQLGDNSTLAQSTVPVLIGGTNSWKSVAANANGYASFAIRADGTLWAWGRNNRGQLGNNSTLESRIPVQVPGTWVSVVAGSSTTMGMKSDGTLWAWGYNADGEYGDGTTTQSLVPKQIGTDQWFMVALGYTHTIGLKKGRTQFCAAGSNSNGQLGDNTIISKTNFTCNANLLREYVEEDAYVAEESQENLVMTGAIVIYPNPNTGAFVIRSGGEGDYAIMNELGQTIQTVKLNSANNYTVNIENMTNGMYVIVGFNNNQKVHQKVVVAK